ncbi:MAG: hypothetical protein LBG92_10665 [Prevotellaceae bacterium]|jgi:hypothetical protein|nr:hypothetical protein [Prevotellaceae bacterium]
MELTAICIIGFLVLGIYKIVELLVKRKERLIIIEKFTSQATSETVRLPAIVQEKQDFASWSLRIALLLIGVGAGSLCAFFLQMYYLPDDWNTQQMLYTACICLFGGIGLFLAFLIELKQANRQSK